MAKAKSLDGIIPGIDTEKINVALMHIVDGSDGKLTIEAATNKFISSVTSTYAKLRVTVPEDKFTYGIKAVESSLKASNTFKSKPTKTISVVMRNTSGMEKNSINVTEETRNLAKENKQGIAGSWLKCTTCERIFDSAAIENGSNCPSCNGMNTIILSGQSAPAGTIGIINRKDMKPGDISVFNSKIVGVFLHNGDGYEEAYLKFVGKQKDLMNTVRFGIPFDINVDDNVFVNETTGQSWFGTTGTSKVSACSVSDFADIMDIYEELSESILSSLENVEDKSYCAILLRVVDEPTKPKDKWLVNLCEPESESEEPEIVTMYIDEENVARQLIAGDVGIFEGRYTESSKTVGGETQINRTLNVNVESSGVPIFIMGEKGTKLVTA